MSSTKERRAERFVETLSDRAAEYRPRFDYRWLFWLRRVMRDLTPGIAVYLGFGLYRYLNPDYTVVTGERNAQRVIDLEQRLGIHWEQAWQSFALDHTWLIRFLNWVYILGFVPFLLLAVGIAFWRRPVLLERWRAVFGISLLLTVVIQALFPLAPPRLLDGEHALTDTLQLYGPRYYGGPEPSSAGVFNVYAAMPSMHAGWPVFGAGVLWAALGRPRWLLPMLLTLLGLMVFAVVATGNHYLVDAIVGFAVIIMSFMLIRIGSPAQRLHDTGPSGVESGQQSGNEPDDERGDEPAHRTTDR